MDFTHVTQETLDTEVQFSNRYYRRLLRFKKNNRRLCSVTFMVVIFLGQIYVYPSAAYAKPTDLSKLDTESKFQLCRRACKLGFDFCEQFYNITLWRTEKNRQARNLLCR